MSLSDLASLGSFVSGVAVLISLIYLALQVRQAEKNQRSLMQQGQANRICDLLLRNSDPSLAMIYRKGSPPSRSARSSSPSSTTSFARS